MGVEMAHTPSEQVLGVLPEFAGELQRYVASQRESHHQERRPAQTAALAQDDEKVAGLSGVVAGEGQGLGASAAAHVEAMRGPAAFEGHVRHAARVAGGAGAF
jgi:hypothetical protein